MDQEVTKESQTVNIINKAPIWRYQYDTDGSGFIEADELKVSLRCENLQGGSKLCVCPSVRLTFLSQKVERPGARKDGAK